MKPSKASGLSQIVSKIQPYIKALMDIKNASLLFLFIFLCWQVGYDTCLKPNIEKLQSIEKMVAQAEKFKKATESRKALFTKLQEELNQLPASLATAEASQPKSLIAVGQSERLLRIARGEVRNDLLPNALPGTQHKLLDVRLISQGVAKETTIGQFMGGSPPPEDGAKPGGPPPPAPGPPSGGGEGHGDAHPPGPPGGAPGAATEAPEPEVPTETSVRKLDDKTIPLTQFDYQLVAQGSYAAFADLINQLALSPKLLCIRGLAIKPSTSSPDVLELTLDLSILIAHSS